MKSRVCPFALFAVCLSLVVNAQSTFHPKEDVSACVLWLDGADVDGDGVVDAVTDGRPVDVWKDKSGQGHDAAQATPENQPRVVKDALGGCAALRFDGNDFLVDSLVRNWSGESWALSVVASLDADAPNTWRGVIGNRFGAGAGNWWSLGTKSDGTTYLETTPGRGVETSLPAANSRAYVYTVVKEGARFTLFRNGDKIGEAENPNVGDASNELRIGRWFGEGQEWKGCIAEVVMYDRALNDGERTSVESYLSGKWKILFTGKAYAKKDTWAATMLATRQALRERETGYGRVVENDGLAELWQRVKGDFPAECARMERDAQGAHLAWFHSEDNVDIECAMTSLAGAAAQGEVAALKAANAAPDDVRWLELYARNAAVRERHLDTQRRLAEMNLGALRLAVADLAKTFPEQYAGAAYVERLAAFEQRIPEVLKGLAVCEPDAMKEAEAALAFREEALLSNPLLDFESLILVKRGANTPSLGLPQNWQSNCILPRTGFDDEIDVMPVKGERALKTVYRPERPVFVGDVDLHFDGTRMLFSSLDANERWQIFEMNADGSGLRQVTPSDQPDVDRYDACYLPDGRILFSSNAYMAAVPCVNGMARTAVLYRMNADGTDIHQLCFDQEHNWCPTMLPNGRVMYLRWEYTDTPHSHDRVLFHMNPDGTGQMEYYGSNSYWPNSLFYARPIPNQPTQFAGIVGGHHGVPRMGELVLFDVAEGRRESEGAIQRIPGFGKKVESTTNPKYDSSLIVDQLVDESWPKFLHPYPLNDKYFLVASKPTPDSLWGIYLVDVFDNMLLLKEEPGYALLEPLPLRPTPAPPVVPDRVNLADNEATVYLSDVYAGEGLKGIPRGTVKQLRIFTYHYLYPDMGGPQAVVGMEGPWDIKRIMGTVPVEEDGSAYFRVPANTPIAVQPLDEDGCALQLMRSWFTGMRGEVMSCVGCHEGQSSTPPVKRTLASRRGPDAIAPWYGPERGFNFEREVQPVLDKYCVGCHDGSRECVPNLKERAYITDYTSVFHSGGRDAGHFSVSYANLHRYVRRPGLESDYHLLMPMEFHANSTQLVQMLERGHHGVKLDAEGWDRLVTWIDLNAPFHGTWTEIAGADRVNAIAQRRRELLKLYANMDGDPEAIPPTPAYDATPVAPQPEQPQDAAATAGATTCPGWPFSAEEALARQRAAVEALGVNAQPVVLSADALAAADAALPDGASRTIDIGNGITMDLVLIPAGEFVMGDTEGYPDERPLAKVNIEQPFWMGRVEVTNEQFETFDPSHDSRVESRFSMQFGVRGFYVNGPQAPVVRVSWEQAAAFCQWLSDKTGETFSLPTEAQWEYACRAGTATPFFYGDLSTDWSPFANLADEKLREFVCHTYKKEREPWLHASKYDDWIPKDTRFNDGGFLSDGVGAYKPNAWGLCDMIGNVWEWTQSAYKSYPYDEQDGRNDATEAGDPQCGRVARGGSWHDKPEYARAASRLAYRPYQGVFNVGFRVACPATERMNVVMNLKEEDS